MNYFPKFDRHLTILLIAQAIAGSTVPVLFLVSGLIGPQISPTLALSTLPISLIVVGIALASPLASWIMSKIGRKYGHMLGLALTLSGTLCTAFSLMAPTFLGYNLGCFISGIGVAFNNQIRFTAAETAPTNQKALVHSWVLMFSLFAAFLGPWMFRQGHVLFKTEYTGSIALLACSLLITLLMMAWLPQSNSLNIPVFEEKKPSRKQLLSQSKFWVGALCGITSFATMTLLMTATPLQMHELNHFSVAATTMTIQSHIIAMYLPSLFSGLLLSWLGLRNLITLGVSLFLICIGIAYHSTCFHHYWWALVLLGVGWNILFLAGSTWISQTFTGNNRFIAQGTNDALVFGTQSIASLASGWLLFKFGWTTLVLLPVPLLVGLAGFVYSQLLRRK